MRKLDPNEVYTRALARPDAAGELDDVELLVYAVKELENYNDMEGWDAFFTGSCSYLYPEVRRCLTAAGDARSLAIVDDYVAYHSARNVAFEPDAIDELSRRDGDDRPIGDATFAARLASAGHGSKLASGRSTSSSSSLCLT